VFSAVCHPKPLTFAPKPLQSLNEIPHPLRCNRRSSCRNRERAEPSQGVTLGLHRLLDPSDPSSFVVTRRAAQRLQRHVASIGNYSDCCHNCCYMLVLAQRRACIATYRASDRAISRIWNHLQVKANVHTGLHATTIIIIGGNDELARASLQR